VVFSVVFLFVCCTRRLINSVADERLDSKVQGGESVEKWKAC